MEVVVATEFVGVGTLVAHRTGVVIDVAVDQDATAVIVRELLQVVGVAVVPSSGPSALDGEPVEGDILSEHAAVVAVVLVAAVERDRTGQHADEVLVGQDGDDMVHTLLGDVGHVAVEDGLVEELPRLDDVVVVDIGMLAQVGERVGVEHHHAEGGAVGGEVEVHILRLEPAFGVEHVVVALVVHLAQILLTVLIDIEGGVILCGTDDIFLRREVAADEAEHVLAVAVGLGQRVAHSLEVGVGGLVHLRVIPLEGLVGVEATDDGHALGNDEG